MVWSCSDGVAHPGLFSNEAGSGFQTTNAAAASSMCHPVKRNWIQTFLELLQIHWTLSVHGIYHSFSVVSASFVVWFIQWRQPHPACTWTTKLGEFEVSFHVVIRFFFLVFSVLSQLKLQLCSEKHDLSFTHREKWGGTPHRRYCRCHGRQWVEAMSAYHHSVAFWDWQIQLPVGLSAVCKLTVTLPQKESSSQPETYRNRRKWEIQSPRFCTKNKWKHIEQNIEAAGKVPRE